MVEIRIHGRGGQGGVTLAKIIATARFLRGDSVQAFGLYAAERSGAPVQAFCRYDREAITTRNLIYAPDHVLVLDATLVGPDLRAGLAPGGSILLNTPEGPEAFREEFPENEIATVDATSLALRHGLGTRSVPIVNTALAGAAAAVLDFPLSDILAALEHLRFTGGNEAAAREAFEAVRIAEAPVAPPGAARPEGRSADTREAGAPLHVSRGPSFLRGAGGDPPAIRTGRWATEQPHRQQWIPPCNHVCPAGNDVQGFLRALAEDRPDDALAILLETTPFPAVCGRVCPAPCMASCNRSALEGPVDVRGLERWAGDHGEARVEREAERGVAVAVVGSGPAGLSAAYHLARRGYDVSVFESGARAGGLLRTGIPEFRLPAAVLDRELARILALGVTLVPHHPVDRNRLLELARGHAAVLVATGLQELRELRLGVGNDAAVEQGIVFLDRVRSGLEEDPSSLPRLDGLRVAVVGGGNTAMDAARTALRLGAAAATVVYRRGRAEMPAIAEEVEEAVEEGVELELLTQPVELRAPEEPAGPHALVCRRMTLGEPDASGRRRPEEVPGSRAVIPCHRLILALGQSPDLSVFPEGTEVREGDELLGVLETPVYAVGDLATGDGTVAGAIGSGRRSALHIHAALSGEAPVEMDGHHPREGGEDVELWHDEVIRPEAMRLHLFERSEPAREGELDPGARRTTFREVHQGLVDPSEARRCLSCGVCNECDLCVTFCPEGVLKREGHDLVFDYAHCKGCGICVTECPRNVVFMSHL